MGETLPPGMRPLQQPRSISGGLIEHYVCLCFPDRYLRKYVAAFTSSRAALNPKRHRWQFWISQLSVYYGLKQNSRFPDILFWNWIGLGTQHATCQHQREQEFWLVLRQVHLHSAFRCYLCTFTSSVVCLYVYENRVRKWKKVLHQKDERNKVSF